MQGSEDSKTAYRNGWGLDAQNFVQLNNYNFYETQPYASQIQPQMPPQQAAYTSQDSSAAHFTVNSFYSPMMPESIGFVDALFTKDAGGHESYPSQTQSAQDHSVTECWQANGHATPELTAGATHGSEYASAYRFASGYHASTDVGGAKFSDSNGHLGKLPLHGYNGAAVVDRSVVPWNGYTPTEASGIQRSKQEFVSVPSFSGSVYPQIPLRANGSAPPQPPNDETKNFHLVARSVWKYLRDVCDQAREECSMIRTRTRQ